jgi:hypothetical protein
MRTDPSDVLADAAAANLAALLATGERLLAVDIELLGRAPRGSGGTETAQGVGVLPLHGSIMPRGQGGLEGFVARLANLVANPDVGAIIIDVDSPGGAVAGTSEAADAVRAAAAVKPVYALADSLAASAAYWIASQASQLWVTPSGAVGSIGIIGMHMDVSKALEMSGVTATVITAGKYKGEQSPFAPLSEEARAHIQSQADAEHANFIRAVAAGRRVSQEMVASDFGQGRIVPAAKAVKAGMADRVGTMADLVGSLRTKTGAMRRRADFIF